jgi:nudix-type nucleoside diphosphatase (YffH/AdpP family)
MIAHDCGVLVKIMSMAMGEKTTMSKFNYRIAKTELMAKGWSTLSRLSVEATEIATGDKKILLREVSDHGHGAAILPIDRKRGLCFLVKQWRAGAAFAGENEPLLEACAGLLDQDDPLGCVAREAREELGLNVHNIRHVLDCFASPGALSERLSLFLGDYGPEDRFSPGGGLDHEHEDIEVVELPLEKAFSLMREGVIIDAKTIILLQHVMLQA